MPAKKHLATITILIKDRQTHAQEVQRILTDCGHLIMARLGVNPQRQCIANCAGFVVLAVEGTVSEINRLTKELDSLYGIVAKKCLITE